MMGQCCCAAYIIHFPLQPNVELRFFEIKLLSSLLDTDGSALWNSAI